MIRSCKEGRVSQMITAFLTNLNTVNLKILPNHGGIFMRRFGTDHSLELWKDLSSRLIVKKLKRLCHFWLPSC